MRCNTSQIVTERLILRNFVNSDAESLFQILKDDEVNEFLPWFPMRTVEETRVFINENFIKFYELPNCYRYAICLRENNLPIGYINIAVNESHDLGYGLKKEYWNRGIVTEACKALIEVLKGSDIKFVTATHDINNPRSGAVMQKIGMKYCYSYEELVMPKNQLITFRMYQLNFPSSDYVYMEYWNKHDNHFIEKLDSSKR